MPNESVLIIEDDTTLLRGLKDNFELRGYRVSSACDGEAGLEAALSGEPDLILLDIMLPKLNGFEICRQIREADLDMPIIMLTAKGQEEDVVRGLNLGADDYVTKPFSPRELMGRVRAVLRRSGARPADPGRVVRFGSIRIDGTRREVTVGAAEVSLAAREFSLLWFLADHVGHALTRRQILDGAWGSTWIGDERTVDVHVRQLRRKLGGDLPLDTVRGVGYRLG